MEHPLARDKRKKLPAAVLQGVQQKTVHDRRASVVLTDVAPITVDDPYALEPGDKIVVMRSLRDDPLGAMHNSKQIDEAQYIAGRHWQRAFELSEIGGAKAFDYTRDKVDGGGIAQSTLSDAQLKAHGDIGKADSALGYEGRVLVQDILGLHMTVSHAAAKRGRFTEQERKYIGRRFRECLETLAVTFGYATKGAGRCMRGQ